jgi:hypothetical protein
MNDMEQILSPEEHSEKHRLMSNKIIANFENKTCINCNKWAGGSSVPNWKNGFCGEDCHKTFLNADPSNEFLLQSAKSDLEKLKEKRMNEHNYMVKKLVSGIENNVCLKCGKNEIDAIKNRADGFCSKICYDRFIEADPQNDRYLQEAEGIISYNRHLAIESEKMTVEKKDEEPLKKAA